MTEVLFNHSKYCSKITLNRPKALNALNLGMIRSMTNFLMDDQTKSSNIILLKGNGRAFCAGGDVKAVIEHGKSQSPEASNFFKEEYQLDHLMATYPKTICCLLDGITMGGGVGISIHTPFRIATENTLFAMPETAIGLFPDVGGSFFLSRLDGQLGTFLALTGHKLKGMDNYWAGIATHYIHSSNIPKIEDFVQNNSVSASQLKELLDNISDKTISFSDFSLGKHRSIIDKCFDFISVEEIFESLKADGSPFALDTLKTLQKMSPTSLKLSLKQIRNGSKLDLQECFKMEYRLAYKTIEAIHNGGCQDFYEGVSALLIDKGRKPNWNPKSLDKVDNHKIDSYFQPDDKCELKFLNEYNYEEYPYNYGIASEKSIMNTLKSTGNNMAHTVSLLNGNPLGLKEKIEYLTLQKSKI